MSRSMQSFTSKTILPAGSYYVGDPCYAIPYSSKHGDLWEKYLNATGKGAWILEAEVLGFNVVASTTWCGDGCYLGSDGNEYPVDAGLIGVVPKELVDKLEKRIDGMHLVEFKHPFRVEYDNGLIAIGHVKIQTRDDGGDEYE